MRTRLAYDVSDGLELASTPMYGQPPMTSDVSDVNRVASPIAFSGDGIQHLAGETSFALTGEHGHTSAYSEIATIATDVRATAKRPRGGPTRCHNKSWNLSWADARTVSNI